MKKISAYLKFVTFLLSLLLIVQGCVVYRNTSSDLASVVNTNNRAKITFNDDLSYHFRSLTKENNQLYGIAKKASIVAKDLAAQIKDNNPNKNLVTIALDENTIKKIQVENKNLSTAVSIVVPVFVMGIGIIIIGNSLSFSFDLPLL